MKERTITVNGFSKKYSMTGWRLGYVGASRDVISALIRIHQYATICATSFAQWGAVAALKGPQADITHMMEEFDRRRNLVYNALRDMPRIQVVKPLGAFYIFPNIKETGKTPMELTQYLIEEAKIAVVPGSVFGDFGGANIRISYANSYKNLRGCGIRFGERLLKLETPEWEAQIRPAVALRAGSCPLGRQARRGLRDLGYARHRRAPVRVVSLERHLAHGSSSARARPVGGGGNALGLPCAARRDADEHSRPVSRQGNERSCREGHRSHRCPVGGSGEAYPIRRLLRADEFYAPVATRLVTSGVELNGPARDYQQRLLDFPAVREWCTDGLKETEFLAADEPYATAPTA